MSIRRCSYKRCILKICTSKNTWSLSCSGWCIVMFLTKCWIFLFSHAHDITLPFVSPLLFVENFFRCWCDSCVTECTVAPSKCCKDCIFLRLNDSHNFLFPLKLIAHLKSCIVSFVFLTTENLNISCGLLAVISKL